MSIHFISGKPGGGKSLYAVRLVVEELIRGTRPIYTNLALKLPELNEYLTKTYPNWGQIKLPPVPDGWSMVYEQYSLGRICLLSQEETQQFWTYRPGNPLIEVLSKARWRSGEKPSYAGVTDHGVFYVIDEVHNFFGSRQWASTGQDVLYYLSQHRKLGDTLICITQAVSNVDKQFRTVAQDYTYLRNLGKESYGKFRLPGVFLRKTFGGVPTDNSKPMESGSFKLDVEGLASVYDTAQGVGIHGRLADTMERKKGLHWGLWVFGVVVFCCLVLFGAPRAVAGFFTRRLPDARIVHGGPASAPVVSRPVVRVEDVRSVGVAAVNSVHSGVGRDSVESARSEKPEVYVTGRVVTGGRVTIMLSDKRTYRYPDRRITMLNDEGVTIDGKTYVWK